MCVWRDRKTLVNLHLFPHPATSAWTYAEKGAGENSSPIVFVSYVAETQRSGGSPTCLPCPGPGAAARLAGHLTYGAFFPVRTRLTHRGWVAGVGETSQGGGTGGGGPGPSPRAGEEALPGRR